MVQNAKMMLTVILTLAVFPVVIAERCCPGRPGPIIIATMPPSSTGPICNGDTFDVAGIQTNFADVINTNDSSLITCGVGSLVFKYTCETEGFVASVECTTQFGKRDLVKRIPLLLRPGDGSGCSGQPIPILANSEIEFEDPTPLGQETQVECISGFFLEVRLNCESGGFELEPLCVSDE